MAAYALGVTPLLHLFYEFASTHNHSTKEVAFADDFRKNIRSKIILRSHNAQGPKYSYFPKASKSYLIVKIYLLQPQY